MNKIVKGSIAGAAGVALLLGGAGTFALWNDTAAVSGGEVASGTLTIAPSLTAGSWKDISSDGPVAGVAIPDIEDFLIVPGDTLEYKQDFVVNATGDNLTAELSLDASSITGDTDLLDKLDVTVTATESGAALTAGALPNTFVVAPSSASTTVSVTFTVTLPATVGNANGEGTIAQGENVDLSGLSFTLQQTRP